MTIVYQNQELNSRQPIPANMKPEDIHVTNSFVGKTPEELMKKFKETQDFIIGFANEGFSAAEMQSVKFVAYQAKIALEEQGHTLESGSEKIPLPNTYLGNDPKKLLVQHQQCQSEIASVLQSEGTVDALKVNVYAFELFKIGVALKQQNLKITNDQLEPIAP